MQRFAVPPQARKTNYPEPFAARVCKPNHPFVESRGAASSDKPMSRACAGRRPAGGPVHLDHPKDGVHLTAGAIRMKHSVHRSQMRAMSKAHCWLCDRRFILRSFAAAGAYIVPTIYQPFEQE